MLKKQKNKKKFLFGFTIIELLVIVAIIALLAALVITSLQQTRTKSRDSKRKSDLKQIQSALAMYYNDNNSSYPNCLPWVYSTDANWKTTGCLAVALKPYLNTLPVDPKNDSSVPWTTGNYSYAYGTTPDLQNYDLVTQLEIKSDADRCELRQWVYRNASTLGPWCNAGNSGSPMLYADH